MTEVKLESTDGKVLSVPKAVAEMSVTIKQMLSEIQSDAPIPLANVKGPVLVKVMEWCDHHLKNPDPPVPEAEKYRSDNISAWDQNFMKVDMETLFEIVLAANYMDIKGLLDLGCKTIANLMRDKTLEEIRVTFTIPEKK